MRVPFLALLAWLIAGHASTASATNEVEFGCQDLVVVGRIRSLTYTPINDPEDIIGHALWSTEISIERVLNGSEHEPVVYATVISHGQIREDMDFLIVLTESLGPGFVIRSFNSASDARLAPRCTNFDC